GLDLRGVALGGGRGAVGERLAGRGIADDDDAPALAVSAVGREARVVQDLEQHRVGHRLVGELARGERRPHHLVELHGRLLTGAEWLLVAGLARKRQGGDAHVPTTSSSAARRPPPARDTTRPASGTASSARRTRAAPSAWAAC